MPWMAEKRIPVMAYSRIEQGRLLRPSALEGIARKHDATIFQVALAWALDITLDAGDLAAIDGSFKPPRRTTPLEMI